MAYKKILVCLDGSALAETALPHAQMLASHEEAEIILLRVSTNPAAEFSFSDPGIANSIIEEMEAEALAYMQSARGKLQRAGFQTSFLIRQGAIAETILHVAAECQADVIVMSTHGRSGLKRWLLGSIADRVVTRSAILPCPCLITLAMACSAVWYRSSACHSSKARAMTLPGYGIP